MRDANQVIKVVWDATAQNFRVTVVGVSTTNGTKLSAEQVWKKIYDPATNTIRVAAV